MLLKSTHIYFTTQFLLLCHKIEVVYCTYFKKNSIFVLVKPSHLLNNIHILGIIFRYCQLVVYSSCVYINMS